MRYEYSGVCVCYIEAVMLPGCACGWSKSLIQCYTFTSSYITSAQTQLHYCCGAYATLDLAFISVSVSPSSSISLSQRPQLQMASCPRDWQLPPPPHCRWHGSVPCARTLLGHCTISSRWRTRPPDMSCSESPSSSTTALICDCVSHTYRVTHQLHM